jgi:predicted ATPase
MTLRACTVDWSRGEAARADGGAAHLSRRELQLLGYLAAHPDRVIPREELLVEVFGIPADAVSRAADTTVRRLREKIERDPQRPDHLLTVYGEGYRFAPGTPFGAPAPDDPEPFVGRDDEVRALIAALGEAASPRSAVARRILLIRGPPGAGKTRLARHVAARLAPALSGGTVLADLTEARDLPQVAVAVAGALGIAGPEPGPRALSRAADAIRCRGPCLVMLDNCEGVTAAVGTALEAWRGAAPEARFLATSRSLLPQADDELQLGPMSVDEAVALFEVLAQRVRPGFRVDEARGVVETLVERLDRLPLAVALAAGRAGAMSPRAILDRLDDRFRLLASRSRDATSRQRTLRAALDASWDQLPAAEREAFLACSVFRGGFDAASVEAVIDAPDALARVAALCDRSLLERRGARFGGYAFVQAYGQERLAEDPAAERALHRRHAEVFAARVRGSPRERRGQRLSPERANLVIAAERAATWPDGGDLLAATTLGALDVIGLEGPFEQAAELLEAALSSGSSERPGAALPDADRFHLLVRLARLDLWTGLGDPWVPLGEAEALAERLGDRSLQSTALRNRAILVQIRTSPAEALPLLEVSVRLAREGDDAAALCEALGMYGSTLRALGRTEEAVTHWREALRLAEAHQDVHHAIGLTVSRLAAAARAQGRFDEARALTERALRLEEDHGDLRGVATVLSQLGNVEVSVGRWGEARSAYERALEIARQVGIRDLEARLYGNLALCDRATGALDRAEAGLRQALALFEALGEPPLAVQVRGNLGVLALDRGDPQGARELLEAAVTALLEAGDAATANELTASLVVARVGVGDLARAREDVARGEAAARRIGNPQVLAQILAARGRLEHAEGQPEAMAATLAEAEALVAGLDPAAEAARAVAALRSVSDGDRPLDLGHRRE